MAAKPWLDMSNWTKGPVTFANAIGLGKYISYQPLNPVLPAAADQAAQQSSTSGSDVVGGGQPVTQPPASGKPTNPVAKPANSSQNAFWVAVLTALGAPANSANINSLNAWARKESVWPGGPNKGGLYNPLNTTLGQPGATNYNSVGVKNYNSPASGVVATTQTLLGGYPQIVSALRSGKGLCGNASIGPELYKWSGSNASAYTSVC